MARLNVVFASALLDANGQGLPNLLDDARRHNPTNSLRSMLLFSAGQLMQVIDGEVEETRRELQRLWTTPHYRDAVVVNEVQVQEPSLDGTSLGSLHLSATVMKDILHPVVLFALSEAAVVQHMRPGIARNLLQQFARDYS